MVDELAGWELRPPVLLADAGDGEAGEFRAGLDARQLRYLVEVGADPSASSEHVHPVAAPYSGKGVVPARAPATSLARSPSSPWRPPSRPAWS